ncbi:MAG: dTDP-4-dehydrorhamnose 3,5-epimerase, partial [bacterium]
VTFEPVAVFDHRGFFTRTLSVAALEAVGLTAYFAEESQSRSRHCVLRGLHGRSALSEGKLVRCARGEVFEVVVDLRPWSPTFTQWESFVLDDCAHRQIWIPPGMVHGFVVLSALADICYRMDAVHDPSVDIAIAWDDPDLAIPWPIATPILSERDRSAPRLADLRGHFEEWYGSIRPAPVDRNGG